MLLPQLNNNYDKEDYTTPVIADVHFNPEIALAVAEYADKVRINPGNFTDPLKFITLLEKCRKFGTAIRIGVNHGSLAEKIMEKFGDTPSWHGRIGHGIPEDLQGSSFRPGCGFNESK